MAVRTSFVNRRVLKRALVDANTTRVALARALGISPASLNDYLIGRRRAPEGLAGRIAALLNISVAELTTEDAPRGLR